MNNDEKNSYVRGRILAALLQMMHEQPFDDITVSALVNKAQVGRASFYRNFIDKKDVLQQENDRLTAQWKKNLAPLTGDDSNDFSVRLLDFYKENEDFYLSLYRAGFADMVLQTLLEYAEIAPEMPNALAYLKSSVAYMFYGWIVEWMKRGMMESGSELARMFADAQGADHTDSAKSNDI